MYGKIIFNNIEYVKLFPVFNASMAVFVFYPHLIHMYSTLNPHKIAELSTFIPCFISEKRQIASPSPSNVVHPLSGIVLLSACLSFFRTVFSSVIYGFDYNILFSSSQGFLLDQIRPLMQNGTMPARKVSHKRTDRYSRLPETAPMVFPRLLRQIVWASAQGSAKKRSGRKYRP